MDEPAGSSLGSRGNVARADQWARVEDLEDSVVGQTAKTNLCRETFRRGADATSSHSGRCSSTTNPSHTHTEQQRAPFRRGCHWSSLNPPAGKGEKPKLVSGIKLLWIKKKVTFLAIWSEISKRIQAISSVQLYANNPQTILSWL